MKIIFIYIHNIIYILLLICKSVYSREIIIKNDENFYNIKHILNQNTYNNNIQLYFVDDYYDMSKVLDYSIDVMVLSNITLIGNEKGTEFDYKNGYRGAFSFTCLIGKGETIKFKNIIFKNYLAQNKVYGLKITSTSHNFFAIMDNCTFQNNNYPFVSLFFNYLMDIDVKPQVLFNKCKFLYVNKYKI